MKKNNIKEYLTKNVWNNSNTGYYGNLKTSSQNLFYQSPYKKLLKFKSVFRGFDFLDLGCGEGSKTIEFVKNFKFKKAYGVDISKFAIDLAKKRYPHITFSSGDIEKLQYADNFFDVVVTNFVMEHTLKPQKIFKEVYRVLRNHGYFIVICPNYGAPNRCSPPFNGSRIKKLVRGFISDFNLLSKGLHWNYVTPLSKKNNKHISDYDTTVEPYLLNTVRFCKKLGFKIVEYSSVWEQDIPTNIRHKLFRKLGTIGVFPFKYWGPQHYLVMQKL